MKRSGEKIMSDKLTKPRRAVMRRVTMKTPKPEREARVKQFLSACGYGNGLAK